MTTRTAPDGRMAIPRLPPRHVSRPRLLAALSAAAGLHPLTVLAAGPGAGKTVLLSDWARQAAQAPAWISLDPAHNNPESFLVAVRVALLLARRRDVDAATGAGAYSTVADTSLAGALEPALEGVDPSAPLVVVLDDAHMLTHQEVLDAIDSWLRRWPDRLRLVLAARSDPLLPLHRYRLSGTMSELRAADLAATDVEAAQLLATHSVQLSEPDLMTLNRRTEGWIAGIRLSAMRMENSPRVADFVTEFAIDEASIGEYLMDEVLARQPPEIVRLLTETSFLDEVNGDLATTITGLENAGDLLAELSRTNSFVIAVDGSHSTFRYHQLLAEILRWLLHREPPERRSELMRRAAKWYLAERDTTKALHFAGLAGDWALAADVVVEGALLTAFAQRSRMAPLDPQQFATAAETADGTSKERLRLASAAFFVRRGQPDLARHQIAQITVPTEDRLALLVDLVTLVIDRAAHQVAGVDAAATRIVERCRREHLPGIAAAARLEQAMTHFYAGSHAPVEALLQAAADDAAAQRLHALQFECVAQRAHVNAFWARLRTSEANSRHANLLLRDDPTLTATPALLVAAALRDVVTGDFRDALRDLSRAARMLRRHRDRDLHGEIEIIRALVHLGTGRGQSAREVLDSCETPPVDGLVREYWVAARAAVDTRCAEPAAAMRRLDGHRTSPPSSVIGLVRGIAALDRGDLEGAQAAIRPILTASAVPSIRTVLVAALVLEARIAYRRPDGAHRAAESLVRALELADGELVLPFVGALPDLRELIARHPLVAAQWPLRAGDAGAPAGPEPGVVTAMDPLTDREQAVLRWLATSMATRDIAATMGVSVNTVKTHIAAIYRKLDAPRRREAVLRARQLELL